MAGQGADEAVLIARPVEMQIKEQQVPLVHGEPRKIPCDLVHPDKSLASQFCTNQSPDGCAGNGTDRRIDGEQECT